MTEKKFRKYFPLLTYHRGMPNEIIGAYDFLSERGYKRQVDYVRNLLREIIVKGKDGNDLKPHPTRPYDRRRMIVGLIFEKARLDDFLKGCWIEEHAPLKYRNERMEKWYEDYKRGYKSRYGRFLDS